MKLNIDCLKKVKQGETNDFTITLTGLNYRQAMHLPRLLKYLNDKANPTARCEIVLGVSEKQVVEDEPQAEPVVIEETIPATPRQTNKSNPKKGGAKNGSNDRRTKTGSPKTSGQA